MAYFSDDFFQFFKELEKNNTKEWFHAHKKRYESVVKNPFRNLVGDLILKINDLNPKVQITPEEAIFRINRDVRFSKDKSPYKTNVSALISEKGKKDKSIPGIYLALSNDGVTMHGGAHIPDKATLEKVRSYIAGHLENFEDALGDEVFQKAFGEVGGDKHKRLAVPFAEIAKRQPLIANKSFFYSARLPKETITDEKLPEKIAFYYKASNPVREFLYKALTQ